MAGPASGTRTISFTAHNLVNRQPINTSTPWKIWSGSETGPTSERLPPPQLCGAWPGTRMPSAMAVSSSRTPFFSPLSRIFGACPARRLLPAGAPGRFTACSSPPPDVVVTRERGEERQAHCCTGEFPNGSFFHCASALNLVDFVVPLLLSSFCEAQVSNFTWIWEVNYILLTSSTWGAKSFGVNRFDYLCVLLLWSLILRSEFILLVALC
jgi:hypothetical protein